jgi:hypothetical protein
MRFYSESRFDGDNGYSRLLWSLEEAVALGPRMRMLGAKSRMEVEQVRKEFEMDRQSNGLGSEDNILLDGDYSTLSTLKTVEGGTSIQDAHIEA